VAKVEVHDPGHQLLRRGLVAAVVVTAVYAFGLHVVGDSTFALFAAFAAFATLGLVWFGGKPSHRAVGYVSFGATGVVLVAIGTAFADSVVGGVLSMLVVGFVVRYLAVFGGYIAAGATAVLLSYVLPVMVPTAAGSGLTARELGWATGCLVATVAVLILVPDTPRATLRSSTASLLRRAAEAVCSPTTPDDAAQILAGARDLQRTWAAQPQHPAGPGLHDQALLSILEQSNELASFLQRDAEQRASGTAPTPTDDLRTAVAQTLRGAAELLEHRHVDAHLGALETARAEYRRSAHDEATGAAARDAARVVDDVERGFPLLVVSHLALSIGVNAELANDVHDVRQKFDMAPDVPLGDQTVGSTFERARRLLLTHLTWRDLTFRAAMRTGIVLAIAVYLADVVADSLHVTHKFWVVLGALSVLRTSATGTASTGLQAAVGTIVGFVISVPVLTFTAPYAAGLWVALAVTVLLATFAPAAISYAVGQASFTLFVVVLFTLTEPLGNATGEQRVFTVLLGAGVATIGGLVLWPRGAKAAVGTQFARFYESARTYLSTAGTSFLGDVDDPPSAYSVARARDAMLESRWAADDAFNGLMLEQRTAPEVTLAWTRLLCLPAIARQVSDAIGSLETRGYPRCDCPGATAAARRELDRVASALDGVAERLEHPGTPGTPVDSAPVGDSHAEVVRCVGHQLSRPIDERQSPIGLLWVLEGLYFVDHVLGRTDEPLDAVCRSLTTSWWR
jgi:uncharacterized membrane protein YccC